MNTKTQPQSATKPNFGGKRRSGAGWLFSRMALQNLMRRPTRTALLVLSVALSTAALFSSFVVARGIEASMEQSFARMGADLIVVPEAAMVNITSALLTVQPTEAVLSADIVDKVSHISGVSEVAPQTICRVPVMANMPQCKTNLIAFDPKRDFTVMPWLADRLPQPMQNGEVIAGSRRAESISEEIQLGGEPAIVYGKLGRSGVGPFDESLFCTYDTARALAAKSNGTVPFPSSGISTLLVRLEFGATPEQVRFAVAQIPGVKVVTGASIVTSTRQTTTALFTGMLGFAALMLIGTAILVSLLFSAIISERRREVGLLRAVGSRRGDVVGMLVTESACTTCLGGVFGILAGCALLSGFQHSLVYYLETLHVQFAWPSFVEIGAAAGVCAALALFVGLMGSLLPAFKASAEEPYVLIQSEGK